MTKDIYRRFLGTAYFILAIIVVGLSGLVAQALILRELLVSFYGNELILGIVLANWVLTEALGVFVLGRFIDRIKNKISIFIILQIIFSLLFPAAIYFSRVFKPMFGIPLGEAIGLSSVFIISIIAIIPLGFCHGGLFACLCKIYSLQAKENPSSIGKVYSWETIGTILGGLIFTFLLIPRLNSFQIVFAVSLINISICLFVLRHTAKIMRYFIFCLMLFISFMIFGRGAGIMHKESVNKQWGNAEVLDYRNSVYGNIAVTRKSQQYTFFYNGLPVITTPYPDITFVQDFGNLPLLFCYQPNDILIIGGGVGGVIDAVLKYPIKKLDYAELDPVLIQMVKKYETSLSKKELADKRINIINLDARFFLKSTTNKYDLVLIGLSNQSDLSVNRLFTQEFFSIVNAKLNPDGILGLWLPGSLTYLSQEIRDINACILNGLKNVFKYVRIVPGDYNIILSSQAKDVMDVSPELISQRIIQQQINSSILIPSYIRYRLSNSWQDWFRGALQGATNEVNQDLRPYAVFKTLILWNKKFSPNFANILEALENLNFKAVFIFAALITFLFFYLFRAKGRKKLTFAYSIATTGFFGMLASVILIFAYQVYYGYLYQHIGILISIFMAGAALGSILITARIIRVRESLILFIWLEGLIIIFSFLMALILDKFQGLEHYSSVIFTGLFFVSGLLVGLEFSLASKIYLGNKEEVGKSTGLLYGADLIGGWLAGVLGGIVFLPILGLFNTCLVLVLFKFSSLTLLFALLWKNL